MNRSLVIAIIIVAAIAGALGFAKPGHRMLANLGFVAACSGDSCD